MQAFDCRCGSKLFFHSTSCVSCDATTGHCANCHSVCSMQISDGNRVQCDGCQADLSHCQNRTQHEACNGSFQGEHPANFCRYCSLNDIIPSLSSQENLQRWRRLEQAKHRVLYDVERIGLPILSQPDGGRSALVFEFKAAGKTAVSTGHEAGVITIDIAEADSVRREQTRVQFGELQRTLIGHFRHELGHYFWEVCVRPNRLGEYRELFGDERTPSYAEAQKKYYAGDPHPNWRDDFISEYATMHSWEDFAETFKVYLDMIAIVNTASYFKRLSMDTDDRNFETLITAYTDIGIVANEFNRDIGLLDLVPEVFTQPVIRKLKFVHSLRRIN